MEVLPAFLFIVVGLLGSLAQEDLQGKAFIFPEQSNTAHVVLKAAPEQPLTSFTVCLRHATDLTRAHSLFSYATKEQDNELLLYKPNAMYYNFYLGDFDVSFRIPEKEISRPGEAHVCASWESATGIAELWLNGKPLPRKGLKRGYTIGQEASIVLAQEQDSFGGGFDVNDCFVGEISDVYMWERVLTPEEVALVGNDGTVSNPLINWRSLDYEAKGYVVQSTGMEVLPTFLLLLVGLLGSLAQEDLQGKTFIFPAASNTAQVVLKAAPEQPLTSFTVCLRHATDLTRGHSLFSYNTKKQDNEILLYKPNANQYEFVVGATSVTFKAPEKEISRPGEVHVCASWESATGIAELWLNGKPLPRKGLKRGYSIGQEASIVLGQEQDSFGAGFDINQSFVGEISDVYMWESVLTPEEVALVGNDGTVSNPLINWRSLNYEAKGYVVVKPSLAPVYSSRQF
ncbi:hypothetical protein lerEdw1_003043 [Lerista edwardsae]|nr:hypothetical protein lerEdw1_003043 [Lerista edwardsae]